MTDKTVSTFDSGCLFSNMPAEYIYEPWKAPIGVQVNAGCVVGQDYRSAL